MLARKKLETLYGSWEGRLLLINLVNQLNAGILSAADIGRVVAAANATTGPDFTREAALRLPPPAAPGDEPFFLGPKLPKRKRPARAVRVTHLSNILRAVELSDDASKIRKLRSLRFIQQLQDPSTTGPKYEDAEQDLLETLFKPGTASTKSTYVGSSRADCNKLTLARAHLPLGYGIHCSRSNNEPIFCAPLVKLPSIDVLATCLSLLSHSGADAARDVLGLDHLGATYDSRRNIMGFVVFGLAQISDCKVARPTPFDNTSAGRFRGCYGVYGKNVGKYGRTADLASIASSGAAGTPNGVPEIVCSNSDIKPHNREILIGYLGAVGDPRRDAYKKGAKEGTIDRVFLDLCQGKWTSEAIIDTVIASGGPSR